MQDLRASGSSPVADTGCSTVLPRESSDVRRIAASPHEVFYLVKALGGVVRFPAPRGLACR